MMIAPHKFPINNIGNDLNQISYLYATLCFESSIRTHHNTLEISKITKFEDPEQSSVLYYTKS